MTPADADIARRISQTSCFDDLVESLTFARGKRLAALHDLGITTIRDLLHHYPFRYDDFSKVQSIRSASVGARISVFGRIDEVKVKQPRRNLKLIEVSVFDGSAVLYATWFNQPWLSKILIPGAAVFLLGTIEHSFGYKRMTNPLCTVIDGNEEDMEGKTSPNSELLAASILPVYHANAGISTAWIARIAKTALLRVPAVYDPLTPSLRASLGLIPLAGALREIHQPSSLLARSEARRRLAFDEVFYQMLYLKHQRRMSRQNSSPYIHMSDDASLKLITSLLPFSLRPDQKDAVQEILSDMNREQVMDRLLLGDVASGKTIVAAHALAAVHDSGFQAAMMAPTEVLVQQYALKLGPLFDKLGIPWAQLTSSISSQSRKDLLSRLTAGQITVLFGTHALIEPDVVFKNLSLIVIDEQHRFGVDQRATLRKKSPGCDALMMTATPIPRSLALVLYGDLSPTYLTKRHQTSITTTKVLHSRLKGEGYDAIRDALADGHQAYVICPLIAPQSDMSENDDDLRSEEEASLIDLFTNLDCIDDTEAVHAAEREAQYLQYSVFPQHKIGLLTGRMPAYEKRGVMDRFRAGEIDVLVSTTVVEVGVDVPNATVMIIEDADRFGISQLHQLRGRIGRGQWDSKLFLVTRSNNDETRQRLKLLESLSDGFELANADLRMRKEGDVLGSRQHGAATIKLTKILEDADLIAAAHKEANTILDTDPTLSAPEHAFLMHELRQRIPLYHQAEGVQNR